MRPKSPCKDCEERELRCHSQCERYKRYKVELRDYEKQRRENVWDEYADYVYVQQKKGSWRGGKAK